MDKRRCNFGSWSLDTLKDNVGDHSEILANDFGTDDNDNQSEID